MNADVVFKYFPDLTSHQRDQFDALGGLYKEWNEKINVVSRKDIEQLYLHHVLHSLGIAKWISFPVNSSVLDFGTGGGFPGIPLAIMFPQTKFHLVDSIGKKIKVVNEVKDAVGLTNVRTSHSRVEELRDKYDFITCRAVAPLKQLHDWTKHLINKTSKHENGGSWIFLKGGDLHQEISEAGKKVTMVPLTDYFKEDFFADKFVISMR